MIEGERAKKKSKKHEPDGVIGKANSIVRWLGVVQTSREAAIVTGDHMSTCDGAAVAPAYLYDREGNTELEKRALGIVS
jgi:hypothetical protein